MFNISEEYYVSRQQYLKNVKMLNVDKQWGKRLKLGQQSLNKINDVKILDIIFRACTQTHTHMYKCTKVTESISKQTIIELSYNCYITITLF